MPISIRAERPEDFPTIHELVRIAFVGAEHSDGDEHFLVNRLRQSPEYIPQLALVAEEAGPSGPQIVGHIMLTKLKVGDFTALALAPLAVLPSHHNKGIGAALILRGHEIARDLGWNFSILLGHAAYYPRFGYKPASSFGILAPLNMQDVPDDAFMAINLNNTDKDLPGHVEYSAAFFPAQKT